MAHNQFKIFFFTQFIICMNSSWWPCFYPPCVIHSSVWGWKLWSDLWKVFFSFNLATDRQITPYRLNLIEHSSQEGPSSLVPEPLPTHWKREGESLDQLSDRQWKKGKKEGQSQVVTSRTLCCCMSRQFSSTLTRASCPGTSDTDTGWPPLLLVYCLCEFHYEVEVTLSRWNHVRNWSYFPPPRFMCQRVL